MHNIDQIAEEALEQFTNAVATEGPPMDEWEISQFLESVKSAIEKTTEHLERELEAQDTKRLDWILKRFWFTYGKVKIQDRKTLDAAMSRDRKPCPIHEATDYQYDCVGCNPRAAHASEPSRDYCGPGLAFVDYTKPAHASEPELQLSTLLSDIRVFLIRYRNGVIEHAEALKLQGRVDLYMSRAAHASEPYVPQSAFEKVADEMWSDEAAHWNEKSFKDKVIGTLRQRSQPAHASEPWTALERIAKMLPDEAAHIAISALKQKPAHASDCPICGNPDCPIRTVESHKIRAEDTPS